MYIYNATDEMNSQNFFMWISSISCHNSQIGSSSCAHGKVKQIQGKTNKTHTVLLQCRVAEEEKELSRDAGQRVVQHPEIPYKRAQYNQVLTTVARQQPLQSFQFHQSVFTFCLSLVQRKSRAPKDKLSIKTILTTWHFEALKKFAIVGSKIKLRFDILDSIMRYSLTNEILCKSCMHSILLKINSARDKKQLSIYTAFFPVQLTLHTDFSKTVLYRTGLPPALTDKFFLHVFTDFHIKCS